MTFDQADVELAVSLARTAGRITLDFFRSGDLAVAHKSDGSPVTDADLAAERAVRDRLAAHRPDDTVVGEEFGHTSGSGGRSWLIDPIDGTKSFVCGVPLYSTLVALVDETGPQIGVIHLPALDTTVWAARGAGCFADGRPAHVNDHRELAGAYVTTSGLANWPADAVGRVLREPGLVCRMWGDGYGYALVATGRCAAMIDFGGEPWDLAAAQVIVEEAGGRFTDLTGAARFTGGNGLATNGHLHDRLLALLCEQPVSPGTHDRPRSPS